MSKVLVDGATTSGVYGQGGLNGDPFIRMGNKSPKYIYVNITGTATVTLLGSPEPNMDFVPVSGAQWTQSIMDGLYVIPSCFKFQIDITDGSVTIASDLSRNRMRVD